MVWVSRLTPPGFMMKQATFDAPRSRAATTGWRTDNPFNPSRASRRSSSFDIAPSPQQSESRLSPVGHQLAGRRGLARPDRHHVGIAHVDALEPELQDA